MYRVSFLITVFISSVFSSYSCNSDTTDNRGYIVSVGDKVPEITLQLTNGETIMLKDFIGKVVVLQFTASWCSVCRREMPHLEKEVWLPNKDKDFILIGVDYNEPIETVIKFKEDMQINYPMALDPNGDIFGQFAIKQSGVTRNIVIDKSGQIAYLTRLFDKKEFEAMKEKISELLDN
ncbi:MAG: TlpA family protein disulfide reductase [Bacteroidales bacterium]|nr:TlpA family protein disulfide reductase [Bacteroidales bacterium]MCF8404742.1 TlpA family protein disulfide reductase [Bacteroidales bacterium]